MLNDNHVYNIDAENINDAWYKNLRVLFKWGEKIKDGEDRLLELRGVRIRLGVSIEKENELERYIEEIGDKYYKKVKEHFDTKLKNPKYSKYTYADRIYNFHGVNQIKKAVSKLKRNPWTKSATITLLDPTSKQKHIPCLSNLDFKIRHNKLETTVIIRSIDALNLLPIDFFEIKKIHLDIAKILKVKPSNIEFYILSLHLYKRDWETAMRVLSRFKWNKNASKWEKILNDKDSYVNIENGYKRFLLFMKKNVKTGSCGLDIGCGTGTVTKELSEICDKVHGLDISDEMLIKAINNDKCNFYTRGDAVKMPFENEEFDVLVSRGVLISHLLCLENKFLRECERILSKDGKLLIDFIQNISNDEKDTRREKNVFSIDEIEKLLVKNGFECLKYENNGGKRVNTVLAIKK